MASLAAAIELTLSRNGTSPNTLTADVDMNSKRLLNLPAPTTDTEPLRLRDLTQGIVGPQGPAGTNGTNGAPGGTTTDGDYGDIVVSSSATVWTLDPTVVTAAARTLLDDTSVGNMRTTLLLGDSSVKNTGTTAGTVAAGDDSRFTAYKSNDQSGATYTFAVSDAGTLVRQTAAGTHTYTINPNATTAIPVRSVIMLRNAIGAGALTISRGAGVSLYINGSTASANGSLAAGGVVTLVQEAVDTWIAVGVGIS
jgi:hypothetical protein